MERLVYAMGRLGDVMGRLWRDFQNQTGASSAFIGSKLLLPILVHRSLFCVVRIWLRCIFLTCCAAGGLRS